MSHRGIVFLAIVLVFEPIILAKFLGESWTDTWVVARVVWLIEVFAVSMAIITTTI